MSKFVTQFSWDETPHLDAESKAAMEASYLPHERSARTKGVPSLGAGAIYPIPEEDLLCDPFEFPAWYRFVYGLDVGWNRTAAIWGAIDPESDVLYLWNEYYRGQTEPPIHAAAIKSRGAWIPGVVDPAARGRSQRDGEALLTIYRGLGLALTEADNGIESGIYNVWTRMSTGRLKVFKPLQNFIAEFRIYRRSEKGDVIKQADHLCDALRYLCASGTSLAAQRPAEQWMGMVTNKPKHQSSYDPMASMWHPNSAGSATGQQPLPRNWMPFNR